MSHKSESQVARFWAKVARCKHAVPCYQCCWPWQGVVDEAGYGRARFVLLGVSEHYAHRIAFAFHNQRLAGTKAVCHACDNPPCCNPSHLWSGTRRQNSIDSARKGRNTKGRRGFSTKLTLQQARLIRKGYAGGQTTRELAATYHVSQPLISHILNGKVWKE